MAQLIKLKSGQYFNLNHMLYTTTYEDGIVAAVLTYGIIELSEKDLEKIDQIADYDTIKSTWQRAEAMYRDAPDD